ncbi:glucose-1-phosphate cytidylyltransferase [Candidatus Aerophobetes bacterium]|uniref:Glucose-1-phosphate cytidylyltransferase n=1 Tax=Aerophobetes bacterium TaxID=2030807 RepID=A0A2A4YJE6_UNCAE|nr:MAG: glucose-1-phosphate cytidylyltransferase [Candidatus Aerophobetes bacterium]
MKVVIFAGGFGSRLCEMTGETPKPMIKVGDKPILWHVMKRFSLFGYNEFVIALGRFSDQIKNYFLDTLKTRGDLFIDFESNTSSFGKNCDSSWKIHLIDTGIHTQTGGRLRKLSRYIGNESFMVAYGDVVGDVNISKLVNFHKSHGKLATLTAVQPFGRYGELKLNGDQVLDFNEKPKKEWISCGFFVLEPEVLRLIDSDETPWEKKPLEALAQQGELMAFKHGGYWQPMDTLKDQKTLESLWLKNDALWLKIQNERVNIYE